MAPKKKYPDAGEMQALICKAASEQYKDDSWEPGVQVAHLSKQDPPVFYVALHRYTTGNLGLRTVVHKTTDADLDKAMFDLAQLMLPSREHQEELERTLAGVK